MMDALYIGAEFSHDEAEGWVRSCAEQSGWASPDAERLAKCVADSADAVSSRAYCSRDRGPVYVKLEVLADAAILELHHEGAIGDKPCDCAAAQVATERKSSNWMDAQLRTHRLRIER